MTLICTTKYNINNYDNNNNKTIQVLHNAFRAVDLKFFTEKIGRLGKLLISFSPKFCKNCLKWENTCKGIKKKLCIFCYCFLRGEVVWINFKIIDYKVGNSNNIIKVVYIDLKRWEWWLYWYWWCTQNAIIFYTCICPSKVS